MTANLPTYLWTEAVAHATYLINRSLTRANSSVPPETKYLGKIPNLSMLKIFGSLAYVHVPKEAHRKLDSKTHSCLFLGIDNESKAYRLYDKYKQRVISSRDVVVDESKVGFQYLCSQELETTDFTSRTQDSLNDTEQPTDSQTSELANGQVNDHNVKNEQPDLLEFPLDPKSLQEPNRAASPNNHGSQIYSPRRPALVDRGAGPSERRYPNRNQKSSVKLQDFWTLVSEIIDEPIDFHTASQRSEWQDAINIEVASILKNQTWEVIDRPSYCKPIIAKWLFKVKKTAQRQLNKFKARLVAR